MSDKREGPRIELRVHCGGCAHLGTRKSYGSNDYEEIDYVCEKVDGGKLLPHTNDRTPLWCPFYPALEVLK